MDNSPIRGWIVIVVLVFFNAVVAAAETALETVGRQAVRKRAEEKERGALRLEAVLAKRKRYLTAIDLTEIMALFSCGLLYAAWAAGPLLTFLNGQAWLAKTRLPAELFAALITFCLLCVVELFGVKLPKKFAHKHAEGYALFIAGLIRLLMTVLAPAAELLEALSKGILKLLGTGAQEYEDNVTEEEIISIVNEGHEQGVLEAGEAEMISNIMDLDEKEAKDIMTHRKKVVALPAAMTVEEALPFCLAESYSRFPVYEETIDNITGILHLKDLISCYMEHQGNAAARPETTITAVAREPYFVPDTQNIDVLFHEMQKRKVHMAVVIDEYGQTSGIVAMEDILEEIVGDIQDEYDEEEAMIIEQEDGSFLVRGEADLEELFEVLGIEAEEEQFDTLNGFLVAKLDWIPSEDEEAYPDFLYGGYLFAVVRVKDKLIDLVRITKKQEEKEEAEDEKTEQGVDEEAAAALS